MKHGRSLLLTCMIRSNTVCTRLCVCVNCGAQKEKSVWTLTVGIRQVGKEKDRHAAPRNRDLRVCEEDVGRFMAEGIR
jgi:hypothetical protein